MTVTNDELGTLLSGAIHPGQLALAASRDPNANAYNQYQGIGYAQAQPAGLSLLRQVAAQEDPSEVRRMRDQAKQYLNQGTQTLADIGKSNGLDSAQWQSIASLMGGNPMEGAIGWSTPKNQMQLGALGQAGAAATQNEYQKQRATGMLQYGAPEARNMAAQDIADYNMPGIINAMANPDVASAIEQRRVQNQVAPAELALKARQIQQQTGLALTPEQLAVQTPGGQRFSSDLGGVSLDKIAYQGPLSPEERAQNAQKANQALDTYRAFGAENTPQVVQQRLDAVDNVIGNITQQSSVLPGGKVSFSPTAVEGLKGVAPNLITEGVIQDLYKKGGIDSPTANVATSLIQLRSVPGMEQIADSALTALQAGKQVNMDDIKGQIEGGKNAYVQKANLNPILSDNTEALIHRGNADRYQQEQITKDAMDRGYNDPLKGETPSVVKAALTGFNIPDQYSDRLSLGQQGYAADAIKDAISVNGKIDPARKAKMIDNVAAYLSEQGFQGSARNDAVQFINYYTKKDIGGMQRLQGGQ